LNWRRFDCPAAACRPVQEREPTTSMIVVDIPAILDRADAINDLPGLIEFKIYLGQVVEIAVRMRPHYERNLWFGEPDFSCRFHRACSVVKLNQRPVPSLFGRVSRRARLVTFRQRFVRRCQHCGLGCKPVFRFSVCLSLLRSRSAGHQHRRTSSCCRWSWRCLCAARQHRRTSLCCRWSWAVPVLRPSDP
jgi:hypothetical protein